MHTKNVLITGASRGIGKACASMLGCKGFRLFLNCNTSIEELDKTIEELRSGGIPCTPLIGDIGNPDSVRSMFRQIHRECEGIDILINNAGVSHIGLLSDMKDAEWDKIIQTNLSSVFYCCRESIPHMVHQKSGKIINISSMWGRIGASCEAAYSASKAGVNGLTQALAKELAPSNIQVNAIACGVIDTAMNQWLSKEDVRELKEEIPAGRFGTSAEVAELVCNLALGNDYLTGQIIGLDGGYI